MGLDHERHERAPRGSRPLRRGAAFEEERALIEGQYAGERPEQSALACSRRALNVDDFAMVDGKVDFIENVAPARSRVAFYRDLFGLEQTGVRGHGQILPLIETVFTSGFWRRAPR